jgi:non-heme chloroperoxidase
VSTTPKVIQIGERQFHYIDQGKGTPLVFVHSALNDYRSWQFQMEPFSRKYLAISYSRRFAYPNKWVGNIISDSTIDSNAADLAEIIRKLCPSMSAHIVGHSYGAFISLYCAFKHPELIKTLVLGEPLILEFLERSNIKQDIELLQAYANGIKKPTVEAIRKGDLERAFRVLLDGVMRKQNFFDLIPADTRQMMMDNAHFLLGELELKMGSLPSCSLDIENLKQISAPTLLVRGEYSPKFFARVTEILAENMPNTEQITIPGTTHDLGRVSKANIFNSKVMEFLERHT